jgi:hypothetical protein
MGSSSSVPEQPRPVFTLVYAPWHVEAPELLSHWKKCIEDNRSVADFAIVNALAEPPKASERSAAGPPPYILKDGKLFVKACTPAHVQQVYNDANVRTLAGA